MPKEWLSAEADKMIKAGPSLPLKVKRKAAVADIK